MEKIIDSIFQIITSKVLNDKLDKQVNKVPRKVD